MIGKTLSHYKVLEKIGEGGMGEVYRAEDSRLDRKVALKILPKHLSERAKLRERFEREARAVSSLNHPHICTLHDIGEQDGIHYLVMEHLEGETLAARLEKGPLPLEQTLEYAIQIADALDKAHRQGVVHRDLKPGNIMLTKSGAKLLDFGLAKLQAAETPTNLSALPTEQANLTAEGTILGTLQYMAPEQLEGKEADGRTDIFAFGATVYEMATGKKAFEGKSQASLIGAILKDDPPPMADLQPMTPSVLDWVVKRCLAKEPDERTQSAADLMAELRLVTEVGTQAGLSPSVAAPVAWKRVTPWGIAAVMAIIAGAAIWSLSRPVPAPIAKVTIDPPTHAPLAYNPRNQVAISPDGSKILYQAELEGRVQLYLRHLDNVTVTSLRGTEEAFEPFFSPDGQSAAFFLGNQGGVRRVSIMGGSPITLSGTGVGLSSGSWLDDTIVFGATSLFRVPANGGNIETLASPDSSSGGQYRHPQILPGGKAVLFSIFGSDGWQTAVLSLETGEQRIVLNESKQAIYTSTGHLVYELPGTGNLMAVPFDLATFEVRGDSISVLEGVRQELDYAVDYALSRNGTLVYVPAQPDVQSLVWVDREGTETVITQKDVSFGSPRVSPDGNQVAVAIADEGEQNIWIYDLESESLRRLTFETRGSVETWSPDGQWIVFQSNRAGVRAISRQLADGSGPVEDLTAPTRRPVLPQSLSHDGSELAFGTGASTDIQLLSMEGDRETRSFITSPHRECCARFSPDSEWIAYMSNEDGQDHIYVSAYSTPGVKYLVSGEEGGGEPVWSRDGNELFYRIGDRMMVVSVQTEPSFRGSTPRVLFERPYAKTQFARGYQYYDVSPDGQRFLMIKEEQEPGQMNVILNWFEELKRLVPTD